MSNKTVLLFAALFLMIASQAFSATPEAKQVARILLSRTNGNDAFYNKMLAPAKSLDVQKNSSERIQAVNNEMVKEIDLVITAFKTALRDKKTEAVSEAVKKFDPEIVNNGGAYITFVDGTPSSANSRTVTLIPKKNNPLVTATKVLTVLTSYKRSAKPSDFVYEYADVQNLTAGQIKATTGSDTSWKTPAAPGPMKLTQNYALKKCRQILGWRCVTSLYRTDNYFKGVDAFSMAFISMIDLSTNPDHPDFASDKRSANQVSGSTAIYIVKETADWVLVFGSDMQINDGKLQFATTIQAEFKKDFQRFRERLAVDLNVPIDSLK